MPSFEKFFSMIQHIGKIVSIKDNIAEITFQQTSACSSCHAKGTCLSTDTKEGRIFSKIDSKLYAQDEEVLVNLATNQGFKAIFLAYIIPFILILLVLIIASLLNFEEWISGLLSLAFAGVYYFGLKLFGKKITQTMTFEIEKITNT